MTETAIREDLEERLKDSPGCETVHQPCNNPVAWLRIFPCCGDRALLCDEHKRKAERNMKDAVLTGRLIKCLLCGNSSNDQNIYIPV